MEDMDVYILQVNISLAVFYLLYRIVFARDTFFVLRRFFLLVVAALSFLCPLIPLAGWLENKEPLQAVIVNYTEFFVDNGVSPLLLSEKVAEPDLYTSRNVLLMIWQAGCLLLLLRLFVRLFSVICLRLNAEKREFDGQDILISKGKTAPFSFFGWVFIHPVYYNEQEFREIMTHERTHVNQWHSLDILAGEVLCILFWFNPVVWLLRFEIRQNLEFIADRNVLASGYNRKDYQYHLLGLSHQSVATQIINNFNVSQLKKRIMMMNKKKVSKWRLMKYALLFPVAGILVLVNNASAVAENTGREVADTTISQAEQRMEKVTIKGDSVGKSKSVSMTKITVNGDASQSADVRVQKLKDTGNVQYTITKTGGAKDTKITLRGDSLSGKEVLYVVKRAYESPEQDSQTEGAASHFATVSVKPKIGESGSENKDIQVVGQKSGERSVNTSFTFQVRTENDSILLSSSSPINVNKGENNSSTVTSNADSIGMLVLKNAIELIDVEKKIVIIDGKLVKGKKALALSPYQVEKIYVIKGKGVAPYTKQYDKIAEEVIIITTRQ